MQTANIMLSLAGDSGNVVPKFGVTPAEIAVLRLIHGNDAVYDIEPADDAEDENGKPRGNRQERQRLLEAYGRQQEGRFVSPAVEALFPGVAARVFENLDELDLPEELFKAERRVNRSAPAKVKAAEPKAAPKPGTEDLGGMTKAQLVAHAKKHGVEIDASAKKDDVLAAIETARGTPDPVLPPPEPEPEGDDGDEDGIGDMPDKKNLFG